MANNTGTGGRNAHISTGDTGESHRSLNFVELCTLGDDLVNILEKTSSDGSGITGVGVEGLDDLLDRYRGLSDSPSIVIGGCTDQGVAIYELRHVYCEQLETHSISHSRAILASGMTDMLMMSPPQCRYICDSALVENAGPGRVSLIDLSTS